MENQPQHPSLLGISYELRQMILKELLSCDEVLRDIPRIAAAENPQQTNLIHAREEMRKREQIRQSKDTYSKESDDLKHELANLKRYKLHPHVLRVCRQLYQEGTPILYKDKTAGITYLDGFGGKEANRPHLDDNPWPCARTFDLGNSIKALSDIDIDQFTVIFKSAAVRLNSCSNRLYTDAAFLPFTMPHCSNVHVGGDIPPEVSGPMAEWDLEKLKLPWKGYSSSIGSLSRRFSMFVGSCKLCFYGDYEVVSLVEAPYAEEFVDLSGIRGTYEECYLCIGNFYQAIRASLEECRGCDAAYTGCDFAVLRSLYQETRQLEARGPWKLRWEEVGDEDYSMLRQLE